MQTLLYLSDGKEYELTSASKAEDQKQETGDTTTYESVTTSDDPLVIYKETIFSLLRKYGILAIVIVLVTYLVYLVIHKHKTRYQLWW